METNFLRVRSAVVPAALLGCLVVIWIGTLAAGKLPASLTAISAVQASVDSHPEVEAVASGGLPATPPLGCSLGQRFPDKIRQWCSMIEKFASDHNLDANLVAAVMWQESGGNPDAYSKSGAVGLMQVMPRDGLAASFICVNGPCFASRPTITELKDPSFNLEYGTRMLSGLVKRHGNLRDALKSYGPANVGYYYADKILAIYEKYR